MTSAISCSLFVVLAILSIVTSFVQLQNVRVTNMDVTHLIFRFYTFNCLTFPVTTYHSQTQHLSTSRIFGFADVFKKAGNTADKPTVADTAVIEFLPSKIVANAAIGSSLSDVAMKANVEIQYKCKKGECGTCEVQIGGKWVKACQTTITSSDPLSITIRPAKKKPAFFSPQSLADGFNNNVLGMVGLVTEGIKVEDEYQARMIREKKLADLVAAKKAEKQAK